MDVVHIYTKAKIDIDSALEAFKSHLDKMPKKLGLATTIQFIDYLDQVTKFLEDHGKEVHVGESNINKGQLLGCNTNAMTNIYDKIEAMLYFGDGLFHPKALTIHMNKPLFCFDPMTHKFDVFVNEDFDKIVKRTRGAALKFFDSKNVGILVSTKPGQQHLSRAERFAEYCKREGKTPYILMSETLDYNSLEDFPFLDVIVNTMCGRIGYDDTVKIFRATINFDDLMDFLDDYEDKKAYNLLNVRI